MSDELRLKDVREPRLIRESADVLEPLLWRWFDPTVRGLDAIPEGPALYVSNHSGGFVSPDTWILSIALLRERGVEFVPHGLAHDVVIRAPILGRVLRRLGGVPASHEGASTCHIRAVAILGPATCSCCHFLGPATCTTVVTI